LHGPYYYRFWLEAGKLRKEYVKRSDVEHVRARCEARQRFNAELRAGWETWRALRAAVRETERS
jgi:hypothetical protein